MGNKFKYTLTICPATINAMESDKEDLKCKLLETHTEKDTNEILKIYDRIEKFFKQEKTIEKNNDIFLDIKEVLTDKEIELISQNKERLLNHFNSIKTEEKNNIDYLNNLINALQCNNLKNLYVNKEHSLILADFLWKLNKEKEQSVFLLNRLISLKEENYTNLFQDNSLKTVDLSKQMNKTIDTLEKYSLLKKKDNKFLIDDRYLITKFESGMSIYNNSENKGIGITIKKYENSDDYIIELGDKKNNYLIIDPFRLTSKNNKMDYDKYQFLKDLSNNENKYILHRKGKDYMSIAYNSNEIKISGKKCLYKYIGITNQIFISINNNSLFSVRAENKNENENKKRIMYLSSSKNEIKISLVNENNLLVFNLFLDENHKKIYNCSYFKDNFVLYSNDLQQLSYVFFPKGSIYHVNDNYFYHYELSDRNNISGIYDTNNYILTCFLKKNIFESLLDNKYDSYTYRKIIDKMRPATVKYKDKNGNENGIIFKFNINNEPGNCELYKNTKDGKITIMNKNGKIFFYNTQIENYVEIDSLCGIKFFTYKGKKYVTLKDIKVGNKNCFIEKIQQNYLNSCKYFEMFRNFYDENINFDTNYYQIHDIYKYLNENNNIINNTSKDKLDSNCIINKENILDFFTSDFNKKIVKELIEDSNNNIKIKIVDDLTDIHDKTVTQYQKKKEPVLDIINNRHRDDFKYMNDLILFHIAKLINKDPFHYSDKMIGDLDGLYHYSITHDKRLYFKKSENDNEWLLLNNMEHFNKK